MKHMMGFYLLLTVLSACAVRADITLTSGCSALRISEKAVPISLVLTADGTECLNRAHREPMAQVQTSDGVWHPANTLRQSGDSLVFGFGDVDTTLTLAADTTHDWIGLRVAAIGGTRPQAARFVMLDSAFTEIVGKRLNIGWNNAHALCVMATSSLTDTQAAGQTQVTLDETVAAVNRGEGGVNNRVCLTATVQDAPGPKMEGASAAIIACSTPAFERIAKNVSHIYGLPLNETADGTPVKNSELVRGSYLFVNASLPDADKLIRTCNEAGIRQVLLRAESWCAAGSLYTINSKNFPNGLPDLKTFVEQFRAAGITVGLHCFTPKINKTDASVSQAPDEAQRRLAEIYNTCGFGMIAFDGGENVDHRRFDYTVSQFQNHAMRPFNRPVIHMGTLLTHRLWHSFARASEADTYLNTLSGAIRAGQPQEKWPTVKQHIDARVAYLLDLHNDMMPGELGGINVWARQKCQGRNIEGLQLDELEYLLCRSVAYDCPVSIQTSLGELSRYPLTPQLLRLFNMYETARLAHRFSEAEKAPMREPGKDFTLIQRKGFAPTLVPVRPVTCGSSRDTHAMVGAFEGGSVATFWNAAGNSDVTLDLSPFVARVADFDDQRVVAKKSANEKLTLPVTPRRLTLFCPTVAPADLEQKIKNSLSTDAFRSL